MTHWYMIGHAEPTQHASTECKGDLPCDHSFIDQSDIIDESLREAIVIKKTEFCEKKFIKWWPPPPGHISTFIHVYLMKWYETHETKKWDLDKYFAGWKCWRNTEIVRYRTCEIIFIVKIPEILGYFAKNPSICGKMHLFWKIQLYRKKQAWSLFSSA